MGAAKGRLAGSHTSEERSPGRPVVLGATSSNSPADDDTGNADDETDGSAGDHRGAPQPDSPLKAPPGRAHADAFPVEHEPVTHTRESTSSPSSPTPVALKSPPRTPITVVVEEVDLTRESPPASPVRAADRADACAECDRTTGPRVAACQINEGRAHPTDQAEVILLSDDGPGSADAASAAKAAASTGTLPTSAAARPASPSKAASRKHVRDHDFGCARNPPPPPASSHAEKGAKALRASRDEESVTTKNRERVRVGLAIDSPDGNHTHNAMPVAARVTSKAAARVPKCTSGTDAVVVLEDSGSEVEPHEAKQPHGRPYHSRPSPASLPPSAPAGPAPASTPPLTALPTTPAASPPASAAAATVTALVMTPCGRASKSPPRPGTPVAGPTAGAIPRGNSSAAPQSSAGASQATPGTSALGKHALSPDATASAPAKDAVAHTAPLVPPPPPSPAPTDGSPKSARQEGPSAPERGTPCQANGSSEQRPPMSPFERRLDDPPERLSPPPRLPTPPRRITPPRSLSPRRRYSPLPRGCFMLPLRSVHAHFPYRAAAKSRQAPGPAPVNEPVFRTYAPMRGKRAGSLPAAHPEREGRRSPRGDRGFDHGDEKEILPAEGARGACGVRRAPSPPGARAAHSDDLGHGARQQPRGDKSPQRESNREGSDSHAATKTTDNGAGNNSADAEFERLWADVAAEAESSSPQQRAALLASVRHHRAPITKESLFPPAPPSRPSPQCGREGAAAGAQTPSPITPLPQPLGATGISGAPAPGRVHPAAQPRDTSHNDDLLLQLLRHLARRGPAPPAAFAHPGHAAHATEVLQLLERLPPDALASLIAANSPPDAAAASTGTGPPMAPPGYYSPEGEQALPPEARLPYCSPAPPMPWPPQHYLPPSPCARVPHMPAFPLACATSASLLQPAAPASLQPDSTASVVTAGRSLPPIVLEAFATLLEPSSQGPLSTSATHG